MLTEDDIERVCKLALKQQNEYLIELSSTIFKHFKAGEWSTIDELAYSELTNALNEQIRIIETKYGKQEARLSDTIIETLTGAFLATLGSLAKYYKGTTNELSETRYNKTTKNINTYSEELAHGIANTLKRNNLALSTQAKSAWKQATKQAITDITTGELSTSDALSRAVNTLGNSFKVTYDSGMKTTPDVALRRTLTTELSQADGRMSIKLMEEYNHELAVTSTHFGARPSHALWQGKPFGIHGAVVVDGVRYPGMVELTDYGSITGLKGINCRHMIFPYFPGITELPDRDFKAEREKWGKSSDTQYLATQRQRMLERRIRSTKTSIANMESAGFGLENPAYVQKRLLLGKQQRELKVWTNANKLSRAYDREKAYGVAKQPRALSGKSWTGSATVDALKSTRYGDVKAVNVKGVSPTLFNNQMKAVDRIASKFPILDESLQKYGLKITSSQINGVAYTRMRNNTWNVVFNAETFSSKANFKADVWENIKSGYFMPATKSGASFYPTAHELGHILQKSIVEKELGAGYTYWQYQKIADTHKKEILGIVKSNKAKLSEYAKENSRDFFAECFANLNCGKPNVYGLALSEFLEKRGLL